MQFVKGFNFKYAVHDDTAFMVIKSNTQKYTINTIVDDFLVASSDVTKTWKVGDYDFQVLCTSGLIEQGNISILPNFALAEETESVKSSARQTLEAIEAVIEGRATQAQLHVAVGDKNIQYCTIDELLKYQQYFKNKVAEEESGLIKKNQHTITYVWR